MDLSNLEILKINIQETNNETFTDDELLKLLEVCDGNVLKASWRACLNKANTEKKIQVGPILIENYDADYWFNLADMFKAEYEASQQNANGGRYINHMDRLDEV